MTFLFVFGVLLAAVIAAGVLVVAAVAGADYVCHVLTGWSLREWHRHRRWAQEARWEAEERAAHDADARARRSAA